VLELTLFFILLPITITMTILILVLIPVIDPGHVGVTDAVVLNSIYFVTKLVTPPPLHANLFGPATLIEVIQPTTPAELVLLIPVLLAALQVFPVFTIDPGDALLLIITFHPTTNYSVRQSGLITTVSSHCYLLLAKCTANFFN
jgi:hypothetical protein